MFMIMMSGAVIFFQFHDYQQLLVPDGFFDPILITHNHLKNLRSSQPER